jgi:hypothetical protein
MVCREKPPLLSRRTLLAAASAAVCLGRLPPARAAVVTAQSAPVVNRLEFDPRRPPESLPALAASEAGACVFRFGLDFQGIDYRFEPFADGRLAVHVDSLSVVATLEIDLWVPRSARRKVLEHLEGHRQICEGCYEDAAALARAAAEPLAGSRVIGRGTSQDEARQNAIARVRADIDGPYQRATAARCEATMAAYDRLTEHGAADIAVDDAVLRALESTPAD